jgi:hypothetical protein
MKPDTQPKLVRLEPGDARHDDAVSLMTSETLAVPEWHTARGRVCRIGCGAAARASTLACKSRDHRGPWSGAFAYLLEYIRVRSHGLESPSSVH